MRETLAGLQCCSVFCAVFRNIIPHCGIAVISCAMFVPAFKPTVFGKMKLCAVMRHGQI